MGYLKPFAGNRREWVVVVQYGPDSWWWEHQYWQNRVCHITEEEGSGGWGLRTQQQRPGRWKVQALLILRPPDCTGSDAWAQTKSLSTKFILAVSLRMDRWRWSNSSSWDERKHREERKTYYIIVGIEYAWRRQKTSCAWSWWSLLSLIFNALTFDLTVLLIPSMLPIGEPGSSRLAWSRLTMQRSSAAFSIVSLVRDFGLCKVQM